MAIETKLDEEWARGETSDAVFAFKREVETAFKALADAETALTALAVGAAFAEVDQEIKTEGSACRTIIVNARIALATHSEFIDWEL